MASKVFRVTKGFAKNLSRPNSLGAATQQRNNINTSALPLPEVTVLSNGLTVATESYSSRPSATVGLWVSVGSRYENKQISGVANLTNKAILQSEQSKQMGGLGAVVGGDATRETSSLTVKCLAKDADKAVAMLGSMVQDANLSDEAMQAARTRILNDLESAGDEAICMDFVHSTAFMNTPLGLSVQGPTDLIKSMDAGTIKDFMATHYMPGRMVLVGAGGVKHEDLVKAAEASFTMPEGHNVFNPVVPKNYQGGLTHYRDDDRPFAYCAWVSEIPGYESPYHYHLRVAHLSLGCYDRAALSGQNRRSVLARDIGSLDMAEAMGSIHLRYSDTGLFGNWFVTNTNDVETMTEVTTFAMVDRMVQTKDVDADRGRKFLKQELLNATQCNSTLCANMANDVIQLGRVVPLAEHFRRINECSGDTVTVACRDILYDKDPTFVGVGPVEGLHDYNFFRGKMYSARF